MARRSYPSRKADKKHFKRAYVRSKAVNRSAAVGTGGIRF